MTEIIKKFINADTIVAKIDNDFNPDNSDWIPRVNAWIYDALSQLDILTSERVRKTFAVQDNIAILPCDFSKANIKVYDSNGCEVEKLAAARGDSCCPSTGDLQKANVVNAGYNGFYGSYGQNINDLTYTTGINTHYSSVVGEEIVYPTKDSPNGHSINVDNINRKNVDKNYVFLDCNKIELNFNDSYITIEYDNMLSEYNENYGCNLPLIPNNGIIIEAITQYCIYKMLCRGYKHPVMNLSASQYGTNPYYIWKTTKQEAKRAAINDNVNEMIKDGNLWRSNFYITTFDPRR